MKSIAAAWLCVLAIAGVAGDQRLYVANGEHLFVLGVGDREVLQRLPVKGVGPFTFSPDRSRMYAVVNVGRGGGIATIEVQADGRLEVRHTTPVSDRAGCLQLDGTGRFLAGNNYGAGKAMIWKLDKGVCRGETVTELRLEKRAHSVRFSPDNRWLLVPATGPNKVFVNRFDEETGRATPGGPPYFFAPEGDGHARQPRHMVFHPNGRVVYTTNERDLPGVGVWRWDGGNGRLEPVQDIVTQPLNFDGVITTADLHLTPDKHFLYLSNRDITRRRAPSGRDSIVGFRVDPVTGSLKMIGQTPCERHPRSFCIAPDGRRLFVVGQVDGILGTYRIGPGTGRLERMDQRKIGGRPVWVEAIELR